MRVPRIYQDIELHTGQTVELADAPHHHLKNVLRLRQGATVHVFNGHGGYFVCELCAIEKHTSRILIQEFHDDERESPLTITLVQGISRGQRMDYTLQKSVELGVSEVVPVLTRFAGVALDQKQRLKRMQHWRGVIVSACEQCGRNRLPVLHDVVMLEEWLLQQQSDLKLLLHPDTSTSLGQIDQQPERICLIAGAEGGFSPEEVTMATENGCIPITLGPRVLRTETAALTALTACQVIWGDLK